MATTIRPTANFVLVQFQSRTNGAPKLFMPDGKRDPSGNIVVLACGPDVPQNPPIPEGSRVLLRGDAKIFEGNEKKATCLVTYPTIMAVVDGEDEEEESAPSFIGKAVTSANE